MEIESRDVIFLVLAVLVTVFACICIGMYMGFEDGFQAAVQIMGACNG